MQSHLVKFTQSVWRHLSRYRRHSVSDGQLGWSALGLIERIGSVIFLSCFCLGTSSAVDVQVDLEAEPRPENVLVYVDDTVRWNARLTVGTESYTGEWKSPILKRGETFAYTFTKPGIYVYRIVWYSESTPPSFIGYRVGTVTVQALADSHPAISIVAPPDGFLVSGSFLMRSAVTNVEANVRAVQFFRGDQLIGTVTNSPFGMFVPGDSNSGKTYEFRASVIDNAGTTNFSPRILITFDAFKMFKPFRLPQGQFVSFHSGPGEPDCVFWSEDLKLRNDPIVGQRLGGSTYVDETSTNAIQRFYKVVGCL
jgi:hypothetical protein